MYSIFNTAPFLTWQGRKLRNPDIMTSSCAASLRVQLMHGCIISVTWRRPAWNSSEDTLKLETNIFFLNTVSMYRKLSKLRLQLKAIELTKSRRVLSRPLVQQQCLDRVDTAVQNIGSCVTFWAFSVMCEVSSELLSIFLDIWRTCFAILWH